MERLPRLFSLVTFSSLGVPLSYFVVGVISNVYYDYPLGTAVFGYFFSVPFFIVWFISFTITFISILVAVTVVKILNFSQINTLKFFLIYVVFFILLGSFYNHPNKLVSFALIIAFTASNFLFFYIWVKRENRK